MEQQDIYLWQLPKDIRQIKEEIEQGRVRRLTDSVFKFIFCKDDRIPIFLDLVNALIYPERERIFTQARFLDREISPERHRGKSGHLDVLALLNDGDTVNLEVMAFPDPYFLKRSVAYISWRHGGQIDRGEEYREVKRTISVNILGYEQFDDAKRFRRAFSLRDEESGSILNDDIRLIFLEVPKYVKSMRTPQTKLERWMAYFAGTGGEAMEQIAQQDPMISDALIAERYFMMDWEKKLAYFQEWKHIVDANSREAIAKERETLAMEQGIKKGIEKGRKEERLEVAREMLAEGDSFEKIARVTKLSLEALKENLREQ